MLGVVLVRGLMAVPLVSAWLQENMIRVLGPLLVVTALFLLGLIEVGGAGSGRFTDWVQRRADAMGLGLRHVLRRVAAREQTAVHLGVHHGVEHNHNY